MQITSPGTISATATLRRRVRHAGRATVSFFVYTTDGSSCFGAPVELEPVTVVAGAATAYYTPASAGTYRWVASYSGDINNNEVLANCANGSNSVVNPSS